MLEIFLPPLKLRGGGEGLRSAPIRDLITPHIPPLTLRGGYQRLRPLAICPVSCYLCLRTFVTHLPGLYNGERVEVRG